MLGLCGTSEKEGAQGSAGPLCALCRCRRRVHGLLRSDPLRLFWLEHEGFAGIHDEAAVHGGPGGAHCLESIFPELAESEGAAAGNCKESGRRFKGHGAVL